MLPLSSRRPRRRALDWIAAALVAAAVFAVPGIAIGISNGGIHGSDVPLALAGLGAGLLAVAEHARRRIDAVCDLRRLSYGRELSQVTNGGW